MNLSIPWDMSKFDPMKKIQNIVQSITVDSQDVNKTTLAAIGYDGKIRKVPQTLRGYYLPKHNLLRTVTLG